MNLARHNAYLILRHIMDRQNIQEAKELEEGKLGEAALFKVLKDKPDPILVKTLTGALLQHFPFLEVPPKPKKSRKNKKQVVVTPSPQHIRLELIKAFGRLNAFRNGHTHFFHKASRPDNFILEPYLESARLKVVDRFPFLKDDDTEHLKLSNKSNQQTWLSLKDDKGYISYTEAGMAYFICLFLDRKNAFRFLSRLTGFKNANENIGRATLETFTHYCCRLPRPKLGSSDLLLDILNELGRCPKHLYRNLDEAYRDQFKIAVDQSQPDTETDFTQLGEIELIRHQDRFPYFALRYFDQSKSFSTLRFQQHLGKLRMGEAYQKEMYGEQRERSIHKNLRTFGRWEEVRLDRIPESWKVRGEQGALILDPKVEQLSPQYLITGNRIGIKFVHPLHHIAWPDLEAFSSSVEERAERFKPDAIISTYELQNLFLHQFLYQKGWIKEETERYLLSYIKRIQQFIGDVQQGVIKPVATGGIFKRREDSFSEQEYQRWLESEEEPEQREKIEEEKQKAIETREKQLQERKEKLAPILAHAGIRFKDIPDDIRRYLLGYEMAPNQEEILRKLRLRLRDTKRRKRQLERKIDARKNKAGVTSDRILNGRLATYLAEDLIFMKPPDTSDGAKNLGKPNNDEYRYLQASIAYFSLNREEIIPYFESLGLLGPDSAHAHPFLADCEPEKRTGVTDFYRRYLKEKIKWLTGVIDEVKAGEVPMEQFEKELGYLVKFNPKEIKDKRYDGLPLLLPRGIFNQPIIAALMEQGYPVKAGDNIVYALKELLKHETQAFYDYPRLYDHQELQVSVDSTGMSVWEALQQNIIKEIETQEGDLELTEEEQERHRRLRRFYHQIRRNEQKVRYSQSNDQILWLMARELSSQGQLKIDFANWPLTKVGFDSTSNDKKNILDEELRMELALPAHPDKTIVDSLPIKRYGDFRRFLKDRRLVNLLKYFPAQQEIERTLLERELDVYDRLRETLFEEIWEFEKALYETHQEKLLKLYPEEDYINHRQQLNFLEAIVLDRPLENPSLNQIASLRNKFLHNEIPFENEDSVAWAKELIAGDDLGEHVTEKLINLVRRVYRGLTEGLLASRVQEEE